MDALETLRKQIDQIDEEILALFVKRFSVVKKIGKHKKNNHVTILNKKRQVEKLNMLTKSAKTFGISEKFIEAIWRIIFRQSYQHQA